jgi:sarcosine oxidase subunit gamma
MSYPRRSPVWSAVGALGPEPGQRFDMTVALRFADPGDEARRLGDLALADLSALPRLGIKGPGAGDWLAARGLPVPVAVYGWARPPDGGLVVRVDRMELLVEDGFDGGNARELAEELGYGGGGVYRVERQDASVALCGRRAAEVLAQTCALDPVELGPSFVRTRVAVTSCALKRNDVGAVPVYRLWCDPAWAPYLWDELAAIVRELGGAPVGWLCLERAAASSPPGG